MCEMDEPGCPGRTQTIHGFTTHVKNVKPQPKCHGSQLNLSKSFDTDQLHFEIGHSDCIMKKWVGIQQDR